MRGLLWTAVWLLDGDEGGPGRPRLLVGLALVVGGAVGLAAALPVALR